MKSQFTVYIVDDDAAVRQGVLLILEANGLVGQAYETAEQFLAALDPLQPGCLLLDISLPGINGDELQMELIRRHIHLSIIFLTAHANIPLTVRTIKAGAVDFLVKPVAGTKLLSLIEAIRTDALQNAERNKGMADFHDCMKQLTSRELELLPFALAGLPNKEIGQKLGISHRTVEIHRIRILKKTHTLNFLELSRLCEAHQYPLPLSVSS